MGALEKNVEARCRAAAAMALALLGALPGHASECGGREDAERAPHRRIGWRDFKALGRPVGMRGAVAYITTSIVAEPLTFEVREEGDGTWSASPAKACVRAFMLKRASGFRRGEVRNVDLLHEQGHFDLTEIFARALQERLGRVRESGASPEDAVDAARTLSDRVASELLDEWRAVQVLYDVETECSAQAQLRWLRWIGEQLDQQPEFIQPRPLLSLSASSAVSEVSLEMGDRP